MPWFAGRRKSLTRLALVFDQVVRTAFGTRTFVATIFAGLASVGDLDVLRRDGEKVFRCAAAASWLHYAPAELRQ